MTTITCDICKKIISNPIKIELADGEHPHNGSTIYKIFDICVDCIWKISSKYDLRCEADINDIRI